MTQAPTVAWFWPNKGVRDWIVTSDRCRMVMGTQEPGQNFLCKVLTDELVRTTRGVLDSR